MRIRVSKQRGSVLVICLGLGVLLGAVLLSYLSVISGLNNMSARSQAWNSAIAVAEAGVEEALTQLNYTNNLACNGWALTNGLFFKSRPFADGSYSVTISNTNAPVIYSTGSVSGPRGDTLISRQVRVTTSQNGLFSKGLVAKGTVVLGGGVRTDSFDSANTNYSTGGMYDPAKFKDNGDVATDSQVINAIEGEGGVTVYGHLNTGPNGTVNFGSQAAVGSKAFIQGGGTGIQPGWTNDDMNVIFPDVVAPFSGGAFTPTGGTVNGTNFSYVLGSGNYQMASLNLGTQNSLAVTNNAVLYVTGSISISGQGYIYIAPGASLQLYCAGASASLTGQGVANLNANATNFAYYGLPSNTSVSLSGNAAFTGVLYAPAADFSLTGGGNNTYDLVGSAVVNTARVMGHFNFHYDENLARTGPARGYLITSWNEL